MMRLRIAMMTLVMAFGVGCAEKPLDDEEREEIIVSEPPHHFIEPIMRPEAAARSQAVEEGEESPILD